MRKTSVLAGSIALAAAGSSILGGAALAGGSGGGADFGGSGKGGEATNNCLNIGIPILSGLGIAGQGEASGASCTATANGEGGDVY